MAKEDAEELLARVRIAPLYVTDESATMRLAVQEK